MTEKLLTGTYFKASHRSRFLWITISTAVVIMTSSLTTDILEKPGIK